jgi:hypothetical protein
MKAYTRLLTTVLSLFVWIACARLAVCHRKGAWRLAVGDVNGDGQPDVATSNLGSDSVSVLLGQ